jgi:cobalt/nickel transport system ATP-binding protein
MSEPVLEFVDVDAAYRPERLILRSLSLSLGAGEKLGLRGGNGSGKTTLLHAALGLVPVTRGQVRLFGKPCRQERDFRPFRGRVGLLFQDSDDQLFLPTVGEDVAFGPLNQRRPLPEVRKIVDRILGELGLEGYQERLTHQLSGGEKRLVSLATVLAMSPQVLLLDEPTAGLDDQAQRRLASVLEQLPQAMIIVSHDRPLLERLTVRQAHLSAGTILQV